MMTVQKVDWHAELMEAVSIFNAAVERTQKLKRGRPASETDQAYQELELAERGIVYVAQKLSEHERGN